MEYLIMVALVVYVIYDECKRQMNYWFDMVWYGVQCG